MSIKTPKRSCCLFICLFFSSFFLSTYHLHAQQIQNPKKYDTYSSNQKKFIWFRVFKVASSSIETVLKKEVKDLVRSHSVLQDINQDYFKFSFVRNPWDRVVSCYFNKIVTKKNRHFEACFDKDFDFFVDYINQLDLTKANSHIKLQTKLIPVEEIDFIGKLDNFTEDFKTVCDHIGVHYNIVPHKNKTEHAHYSTYYTQRTRQIIAEKYKEDIEAFGFEFEQE